MPIGPWAPSGPCLPGGPFAPGRPGGPSLPRAPGLPRLPVLPFGPVRQSVWSLAQTWFCSRPSSCLISTCTSEAVRVDFCCESSGAVRFFLEIFSSSSWKSKIFIQNRALLFFVYCAIVRTSKQVKEISVFIRLGLRNIPALRHPQFHESSVGRSYF